MDTQQIDEAHETDADGNPAGGVTTGEGLFLRWQDGPLSVDGERREPNGTFVESVLRAARGRLEYYQGTRFACEDNARAIASIEEALSHLNHRTAEREARGVEGTHAV